MTEKVFYQDSHKVSCEAEVLACEPKGTQYLIALDRTVFFPEGGGQYADTGWIGEVRVTDAHEKEGVIWHTAEAAVPVGTKVTARIDWEERFEKMQQHTGEHIVSGLVHERFGYHNVGFHLGSDYCTMDFDGPISREALKEIEWEANRAVWQNIPVETSYPSKEELETLHYRSKIEIEGQVRIITVPGYDVCACCAPHVNTTGEIGMVKLVQMIHYKGGERITMLCGARALRDYDRKDENIKKISSLLCVKEYEAAEGTKKLKEEQTQWKGKVSQLSQKLVAYQAQEIPVEEGITAVFDSELTGNSPRELMNVLLQKGAEAAAVFAGNDVDGYRYVIGSKTKDVRALCRRLNEVFSGRGGGKPEMVQGSLLGTQEKIRIELKKGI